MGPFERRPAVAAAVSGGPDSLALCLLARGWAESRRGRLTALIVDHALRPESAREAAQVAAWLHRRGVRAVVLRREGPRPTAGVQAAARAVRYGLLTGWCRAHGVLHLLLAHHREDQAETLLLRLARGSGLNGLAAMPAVTEQDGVRLLRPLLGVPRARLRACLEAMGQPWIEDPSNRDPAHARVRWRGLLASLAAEGMTTDRLAATAGRLGLARAALDEATAQVLARAAALHPLGYLLLGVEELAAAPAEVGQRALARCLLTVGADDYTPRLERLERLYRGLLDGLRSGLTLAGCRILPQDGRVLVCREAGRAAAPAPAAPGATVWWDGRFALALSRTPGRGGVPAGAVVARLGGEGWAQAVRAAPGLRERPVPAAVRPSLPALWRGGRLLEVPHLGWTAAGRAAVVRAVHFAPRHPLAAAPFVPPAPSPGAGWFRVA